MPSRSVRNVSSIDAYVESERRRLNIPGVSLAIVEGTEITHTRGFGRARPGGEVPTAETSFYIGSLTKSLTALAVMQWVEAGKIELDAPVQRYLPWFHVADAAASARITVRHLLNQTGGLPESSGEIALADFDERPDATARQARALATVALSHPVGTACEYSNANYNLLGLILEAVSGASYADVISNQILTPLGMRHTYTSAGAKQYGLAVGHQYWFGEPVPAPDMPFPRGSLPAGGIVSTAHDLARYLIAHLNGGRFDGVQILSSAGMDELHRGAVEYRKMGISAGKYAMGWFDSNLGQSRLVWHSGTLPHFGAFMALLPEQNKGVVLLFNACHHWYNPLLTEFGMGVVARLTGEPYAPVPVVGVIPALLRAQALVPAFQLAGVAATLRLLRDWQREPGRRPVSVREQGLHLLLPLLPNLLVALMLLPMSGKQRGYMKLYMPDTTRIAFASGGLALVWSVVRTVLLLRAFRGKRTLL